MMVYLYDVWVNWFEEVDGYNVCHYHEWDKGDQIEILEQVPVIYITELLYNQIENTLYDLPDDLLKLIHNRSYIRKGHSRRVLEHSCIISDGRGILIFDTTNNKYPVKKSRLIPRQEQQVFHICLKSKRTEFKMDQNYSGQSKEGIHIKPKYIYGLTRKERQLKRLLMIAIEQLKHTKNINELRYWLAEWDNDVASVSSHLEKRELWNLLYEEVKNGWTVKHKKFYDQLVKINPFLADRKV